MANRYNDIFLGIIIGVIVVLGLMWYTKDEKSDFWWCSYLRGDEQDYCIALYDKATKIIDKMSQDEPRCSPDYMGGCN